MNTKFTKFTKFNYDCYEVYSNTNGKTIMSINPNCFNSAFNKNSNQKNKNQEVFSKTNNNFFRKDNYSERTGHAVTLPTMENVTNNKTKTKTKSALIKSSILKNSSENRTDNNLITTSIEDTHKPDMFHTLEEKLKIKESQIKNLEKKLKLNSSQADNLEDMHSLFADFKYYLEEDSKNSYAPEDGILIKKKMLSTLNLINENLSKIRKNHENKISLEKSNINELKSELEKYKLRELNYLKTMEKMKVEMSLLENEISDLEKNKNIEKVKKVVEAHSDSYLAKENADLRRRLEIACKFLLKKKEKIQQMNEKIAYLNKRINDIIKSKTFSENEEEKIISKLAKKLKNEFHPHKKTIDKISSGSFSTGSQNSKSIIQVEETFAPNYIQHNLDYRVDKLKEKYRELMKELMENGTAEYVKHFTNVEKEEQEKLTEFISDQMLSYMDLSKRMNKLLHFFINSLNLDKDELMLYIRLKFVELFDSERVTLWIYDQHLNEFYTIVNLLKYSESGSDPYFQTVLKGGIYNKYINSMVDEEEDKSHNSDKNTDNKASTKEIYSHKIEKNFSSRANTRSVLAVPIVDSPSKGQVYGILEVINSHNLIFGYDEEYLLSLLSQFIKWFLIKFSIEEADSKHKSRDLVFSAIIKIMQEKSLYSLTQLFENEIVNLIDAYEAKIMFVKRYNTYNTHDSDNAETKIFTYTEKEKKYFINGGIASVSIKMQTGIFCKYPNEDENYNPLVDIECNNSNTCFYSIPLKRDKVGIFAVLQFVVERDDSSDIHSKNSSHHISKLDYYREKIIEVMSFALQNSLINIEPNYFD